VRLLDGGRAKWLHEGRALSTAATRRVAATYRASSTNGAYRVLSRDLRADAGQQAVVDAGMTAIFASGAAHIPWPSTLNDDGTFRSSSTLETLFGAHGITRAHHIVTRSADGTASAHAWFALSRVLGFPHVRNCEGA
jgi:thiosulfate/3-mercaptopyruvate sulfurtransferase